MKRIVPVVAIVIIATALFAAAGAADDSHHEDQQPAAAVHAEMAEGEIRKVDKSTGRITIKHGPLTNLDMPSMTMVFRAKDPAMLDQVKQGDKIKFIAEKIGSAYVVTALEPAK